MTTPSDPRPVLRTPGYVRLLALAAIIGAPIAAAAYGFLWLVGELQEWLYTDLPSGLGFDGEPMWWPLPLLALAGLLVALTIRYLPIADDMPFGVWDQLADAAQGELLSLNVIDYPDEDAATEAMDNGEIYGALVTSGSSTELTVVSSISALSPWTSRRTSRRRRRSRVRRSGSSPTNRLRSLPRTRSRWFRRHSWCRCWSVATCPRLCSPTRSVRRRGGGVACGWPDSRSRWAWSSTWSPPTGSMVSRQRRSGSCGQSSRSSSWSSRSLPRSSDVCWAPSGYS